MSKNKTPLEIFEALNLSEVGVEAEEAMRRFIDAFNRIDVSPKAELIHRLNMSANGKDPGDDTYNWPGVRGFRRG